MYCAAYSTPFEVCSFIIIGEIFCVVVANSELFILRDMFLGRWSDWDRTGILVVRWVLKRMTVRADSCTIGVCR